MLNDATPTQVDPRAPTIGAGTVVRDRFVVEEELEHGRFGTVYKARDVQRTSDGRPHYVALLMLPVDAASGGRLLHGFKRDFARLRGLSHPNIVKVFDFDCDGSLHFVTMEYVDGESLRSIVDSLRPELLWEREAAALVRAVGDALVYAHARAVVHGDVRLENVIVTAQHDVKVLFTSSCLTSSAPFAVEARDDVHGLACITYELLSGEPPFARQSLLGRQPPAEPKRIKTLSRRQWKVLRAILVGRDERMCSVSEFLEVFGAVGATRPSEEGENTPRAGSAWRWVAAAWVAVLVGAGYVLTRGAPEEPAAVIASAEVPPLESAASSDAARTPSGSNATANPSLPNLDGRLPSAADATTTSREPSPAPPRATSPGADAVSTVTFAQSTVVAAESEGVVIVEIHRTGALDEARSVTWWTSADTARPEDDYADFGPVVETFRSGEQSRRILLPITSDRIIEGREHFRIHLRESGGNTRLGAIAQISVTLVDDDL